MAATVARDLRTGRSPWMSRPLAAIPTLELTRDLTADVVVIGAGISGAMVADALTDAGLDVVILDRRGPLLGSTPASTALLQYEIDTPLTKLAARIGLDRAERIWRRSKLALGALRERAVHLGISADLADRDTLYLAGDLLDREALALEADARRRAGFEVSLLTGPAVRERYGIAGRPAILGHGNLAADPRRLAAGFLRAALGRGARLYAPVTAAQVEATAGGVSVETEEGPVVRATTLVFATGYELPRKVPRKVHRVVSTYCLATRPQPRAFSPDLPFVWEASEPYLYLRSDHEGRIICGGEDEDLADEETRDALLPVKIKTIQAKLEAVLPGIDTEADYAWCGSFGASETGTPSIGPVPRMPGCYAVLGYGGNGITFSMMAAQILRGQIAGTGDPDADLFSFRRRF
ncbi:NAD(P)/FAD-dependent oxidoreductase [Phreatobacter cathodiphilus]|uniref:FAD-dependent oxidoreductase n=1 Tax=Phreatobacter cathodiphilus TaxID=1868589 RepID=A0A2S0N7T4_9HYPH|nr:FAD-binding oxidoreductase [Phreatobacter cathodiphilus]AVO44219.1 FAD-dependent oxidoreductase [Phreatobacter cathodiphilus]